MDITRTPTSKKTSLAALSDRLSQRIRNSPYENIKNLKHRIITKKESLEKKKAVLDDSSSSEMISTSSSSIVELEEPFEKSVSMIFDLSLGLTSLAETLDSVLSFLFAAAICDHSYKSLLHLLNASAKSSADVQYLVIAIAVCVLKEGVPPRKQCWKQFVTISRQLSQTRQNFISFGNRQNLARRNLIRFSSIFTNHQKSVAIDDDIDRDHYGIDKIVDYVLKHRRGSESYKKWVFPDPTPISLQRYYMPKSVITANNNSNLVEFGETDPESGNFSFEGFENKNNTNSLNNVNNENLNNVNIFNINNCKPMGSGTCNTFDNNNNNSGYNPPINDENKNVEFIDDLFETCSYVSGSESMFDISSIASPDEESGDEANCEDSNRNADGSLNANNDLNENCYININGNVNINRNVNVNIKKEEGVKQIPQVVRKTFAITNQQQVVINPVNDTTKEVAKMFTNWNTAYVTAKTVWNLMKEENDFNIDDLYRIIPFAYADFLKTALETFEENGDPV